MVVSGRRRWMIWCESLYGCFRPSSLDDLVRVSMVVSGRRRWMPSCLAASLPSSTFHSRDSRSRNICRAARTCDFSATTSSTPTSPSPRRVSSRTFLRCNPPHLKTLRWGCFRNTLDTCPHETKHTLKNIIVRFHVSFQQYFYFL